MHNLKLAIGVDGNYRLGTSKFYTDVIDIPDEIQDMEAVRLANGTMVCRREVRFDQLGDGKYVKGYQSLGRSRPDLY